MHSKVWTSKEKGGGAAPEHGGSRSSGRMRGESSGEVGKSVRRWSRERASHLIRRRFYSPCCPNPDKLSAIKEAAPPSPPPTSSFLLSPCALPSLRETGFHRAAEDAVQREGHELTVIVMILMMVMTMVKRREDDMENTGTH